MSCIVFCVFLLFVVVLLVSEFRSELPSVITDNSQLSQRTIRSITAQSIHTRTHTHTHTHARTHTHTHNVMLSSELLNTQKQHQNALLWLWFCLEKWLLRMWSKVGLLFWQCTHRTQNPHTHTTDGALLLLFQHWLMVTKLLLRA